MISLLILLLYKNMKSMPSMRSLLYRSLRPSIHIVRMLKLLVRKATINLSEPLLLDVVRWYKQKKRLFSWVTEALPCHAAGTYDRRTYIKRDGVGE